MTKMYELVWIGGTESEMQESAYGDWVKTEDYDALQSLNAELLEALENMAKEFQRVYPIYYYAESWGHETNAPLLAAKALTAKARSKS